jgi:DNA polymerase III subunit epsilon
MYAVVDLETTGGHPGTDKIIEIAIFIHDGENIIHEFSSLVNPGVPIPYFISRLTGITEAMVQSAPEFDEIAGQIRELLGDHIFVAHNVSFDYSFLVYALQQAGYPFESKMLCTCKTSRILFPGYDSYSLSRICSSLSIELTNAHRAAPDAKATTLLLHRLIEMSGRLLEPFYINREKQVNNSLIPDEQIQKIPSKAGVLFFYDASGTVIYVSASNNLRKKAVSIITRMHTKRYSGLAALAIEVGFETTGGILLSSIKEIEAISKYQPRFNRVHKTVESRFSIYENLNDSGYLLLEKDRYDANRSPLITFAADKEAGECLNGILATFSLKERTMFNNEGQPEESNDIYNERASMAVDQLRSMKKNFLITDRGPQTDHSSMIVIEDGRYTGYIFADHQQSKGSVAELLELKNSASDFSSVYKTIIRHVSQGKFQKIITY